MTAKTVRGEEADDPVVSRASPIARRLRRNEKSCAQWSRHRDGVLLSALEVGDFVGEVVMFLALTVSAIEFVCGWVLPQWIRLTSSSWTLSEDDEHGDEGEMNISQRQAINVPHLFPEGFGDACTPHTSSAACI